MNILIVNSSAQGDASVSNRLTGAYAHTLRTRYPGLSVTVRDIGREPVPHLVAETISGVRGTAETAAEQAAAKLSDTLIAELEDADLIVLGVPMYNFGIPSTLKSWFDHVLRARRTFRYSEQGPEGLLTGKRAVVIETRAGTYSKGPSNAMDHQEPHLRTMLAFMGITDVDFVHVEGTAFGPEAAAKAIDSALLELNDLAGRQRRLAA